MPGMLESFVSPVSEQAQGFNMPLIKETIVFKNNDGTLSFMRFIDHAIPSGVELNEFLNDKANKKSKGRPFVITDYSRLKTLMRGNAKGHIDRIRLDSGNNFFIDETVKTIEDTINELKTSIRTKLKSDQTLNDEEINLLMGS